MAGDVSYQLFEIYYNRAKSAESAGRTQEARQMYLNASDALLRTAKENSGETRIAMIRRADKLVRLAESLKEPSRASAEPGLSGKEADFGTQAADDGKSRLTRDDQATTMWQAAGKTNVSFDDIAGLEDVKEAIRGRIILPRTHPEVYNLFKRKVAGGILLYGPPGTGKTMIAKAVATEVDADFFSVRCSDIVGKYFGEAEKNVKSLFETARRSEAAVIFFDEFEALGAERGDDSSVMNRLVPELLSQMDGFLSGESNMLMCMAATNRPWDLDSAFLRPPRLTEKIYVGLPDYDARLFIVTKAFQGVPCEPGMDPDYIAGCADGYNAADIVELCGAIKDIAIRRTIDTGRSSNISRHDVAEALKKVRSSVQQTDIDRIRQWEAHAK